MGRSAASDGKKPTPGDVIAVPFGKRGYALVHVLEVSRRDSGVIGVLPHFSTKVRFDAEVTPSSYLRHPHWGRHLAVQLTGVGWGAWKVVGQRALPTSLKIDKSKMTGSSPTCVAMENILEALHKAKQVDPKYRWYGSPRMFSPKIRAHVVDKIDQSMKFFKQKKLLNKAGLDSYARDGVHEGFVLDSDVLTAKGTTFLNEIVSFDADYEDHLEEYWNEYRPA
ncbi:MAG: hypothetical protein KIT84_10155 [Labilithrix sp.]|nr:hypothetical protein [Labilithrix sp.]MCW5811366.1 hypothetical protein [Labilithrix sp.]